MNAYVRMERVEQFFIPITIHTVKVNINGASGGSEYSDYGKLN